MKSFVIYTALIGGYDNIHQPTIVHEDFDYILFSNSIKENKIGVWEIKRIDYFNIDNTRIARWVKTHPELIVKDYLFSVWLDANIQIQTIDFYNRALELYAQGILISSMWHNERDCIYDEAAAVAYYGLESETIILDWEHKLLKEKYPQHQGLFETNVVFRCHNSQIVKKIDSIWWSCIDNYSRRDQLSFNYVLWKIGIQCPYYLPLGKNTRNSDCVKWTYHRNEKNRRILSYIKDSGIALYYRNIYLDTKKLSRIYLSIAPLHLRKIVAYFLGQYYRLQLFFHNLTRIFKI